MNNPNKTNETTPPSQLNKWFLGIIIIFVCIITFSLIWAKRYYGNITFEEIFFHLSMPLEGTSQVILLSYAKNCILPTAICLFCYLIISIPIIIKPYKIKIKRRGRKNKYISVIPFRISVKAFGFCFVLWICGIILFSNHYFNVFDYIENQFHKSAFIETEYVSPKDVTITFPEEKRNLICIYIESAETTAQDIANGGVFNTNYMPEMTNLAKANISFSHSELLEGAVVAPACGWTIAGLVAETSGLPLKLARYDDSFTDNSMDRYSCFLPGAITLGDILESEGYQNYFMAGSDFDFGGRTNYFSSHGNYEIWDYYSAIEEEKIDEDYYVWWGFEDAKLYSYAKEKLVELASNNQPFNFSMLTVDTHHEDGHVCEFCPNTYDSQYANVWACASEQLDHFIKWIEEQPFYENTTIVIIGDHCSMDSDFYSELAYDKHHGETTRKVYNAFLNTTSTPIQEKNRKFTTLDLFPTILASMGVTVEGNRLGLGTNLFSEEKTLAETYGYDTLFEELDKKSTFYNEELFYPKK